MDKRIMFFMLALGLMIGYSLSLLQEPVSAEKPFTRASEELMSPHDHIGEDRIHVYENRVVLDIDADWARFRDTNSMDPVLDKGTNAIQIIPESEDDVHVGDIVTYSSENGDIIHRVIDIRHDEKGTYYVLKGDNNEEPDPVRVRFDDIKKILVGVIY
ncbi:MAG: signal peptidase I [Nanobdellota archaeon]